MRTAAEILAELGIVARSTARARFYTRCPQCSDRRKPANRMKPCLGVTIDDRGVFAGCNNCQWTAGRFYDQATEGQCVPRPPKPAATVVNIAAAERTASALPIWNEARDPWGTPVEAYLRNRVGGMPEAAAGAAIRYHPRCPWGSKRRTPAMVCLVRDVRTNEPKAIHRTALSLDGRKVEVDRSDRLSLGPVGGGAIKLTPDEDVTACLGVGEGVETTLDLRSAPEFGPSPVWSLISAGNLGKFPVLPAIETLWIAVDNDKSGTGQSDAQACAERWDAAGREVIQIIPSTLGADLNDVFTARRGRHV